MFYLYLKTHNVTNLKYLGFTRNDPYKYKGSGKHWKRHIKLHGYNVKTEILLQSSDIDNISYMGKYYSELWNVVENPEFANLCEEDGNKLYGKANINFRGHPQTEETRLKISHNNGRGNSGKFGEMHPAYGHKVNPSSFQSPSTLCPNGPWNRGKTGLQKHSEETRKKLSIAASKKPKETVHCPHCKKSGGKPAMIRFHFDKCKDK